MATAVAFNLRKTQTVYAINSFIDTLSFDEPTNSKLMPLHSTDTKKLHFDITQELLNVHRKTINEIPLIEWSNELIKNIIVEDIDLETEIFITKCKKIQLGVISAFVLGILASVIIVCFRRVLDIYMFVFLVWSLSCTSLWITLEIIIKDWKKNKYGEK